MYQYPVRIQQDGESYLATFRDIPEAITGGATKEEAISMAIDSLVTAMDFYVEDGRAVPRPSEPLEGEFLVELPSSLEVKVLLLNEMVAQRVRPADLAKRLRITRQEAGRIVNLEHTTKIDQLSDAFKVLGKHLEIRVA